MAESKKVKKIGAYIKHIINEGKESEVTISMPGYVGYAALNFYSHHLSKMVSEMFSFSKQLEITNFKAVVQDIIQQYANVLHRVAVIYIDKDLKRYRSENNFNTPYYRDKILGKESYMMKNYYAHKIDPTVSSFDFYGDYFSAAYPAFNKFAYEFCNSAISSLKLALTRINRDIKKGIIGELFFGRLEGSYKINSIKSSGSDYHAGCRQVLFLEVINIEAKEVISFLYKPSSILADVYVAGDIQRLKKSEIVKEKIDESLFEIVNKYINKKIGKKYKLRTIFGIPLKDKSGHYGYQEILSHSPWHSIDFEKMIIEKLHVDSNVKPQKYAEKLFNNFISSIDISKNSDWIVSTKDVSRLSRQYGILTVLMIMLGNGDRHSENMIFSAKEGVFIDYETSLEPFKIGIDSLLSLDSGQGAMHGDSTVSKDVVFFEEFWGKKEFKIYLPGKNAAFILNKGVLVRFHPDIVDFKKGLRDSLKMISDLAKKIVSWSKYDLVNNMVTRVVPLRTSDFEYMCFRLHNSYLSPENFFENELTSQRTESIMPYASMIMGRNQKNIPDNSVEYGHLLPKMMIFFGDNCKNLFDRIFIYNIPSYYCVVNSKKLYDDSGNILSFPDEGLVKKLVCQKLQNFKIDGKEKLINSLVKLISGGKEKDFFIEAPLGVFVKRVFHMAGNRAELLKSFSSEAERLLYLDSAKSYKIAFHKNPLTKLSSSVKSVTHDDQKKNVRHKKDEVEKNTNIVHSKGQRRSSDLGSKGGSGEKESHEQHDDDSDSLSFK